MEMTKMTVRVPKQSLEDAKRYAHAHDTTLTRLIRAYLDQFAADSPNSIDHSLSGAPIVQRLIGSLSQGVTVEDYRRYLEEKYGQAD